MSDNGDGSLQTKKVSFSKIILRRMQPPEKQQIIEQNLKSLEVHTKKKRIAQAHYYGNSGQSPLTRTTVTNESNKQPVHARLGNGKIRLRRMYNFNNNGIFIKNRRILRINRNPNDMKFLGPGRRTIFKRQSAQIRLQRIRQQRITNNIMENPGKIKLRLRRPDMMQAQPTNYTVQVNNNAALENQGVLVNNYKHSVRAQLNKQLQAEIHMIQAQNPHEPQVIPSVPIHVEGYGMTNTTLHDRFSLL